MISKTHSVQVIRGVTIVTVESGALSMTTMTKLLRNAQADAVLDLALQQRIGAELVFGAKAALAAYRATNPPVCEAIQHLVAEATLRFSGPAMEEIRAYLEGYDRGASADALLQATSGVQCAGRHPSATPSDSSDFGRCLRLYLACSVVRENFGAAEVFQQWDSAMKKLWHATLADAGRDTNNSIVSARPGTGIPWERFAEPYEWSKFGLTVVADRHLPSGRRQHLVTGRVHPTLALCDADIFGEDDEAPITKDCPN